MQRKTEKKITLSRKNESLLFVLEQPAYLVGSFFSWSGQILHPLQLLRLHHIHVDPFLLWLHWHMFI